MVISFADMPPKKKQRVFPDDVKWCMDRADHLSFKDFISTFDCLDRQHAQQRFSNILVKHFNTKSERDKRINNNFSTCIKSADYLRFWAQRTDSINISKADLASAEMVDSALDHRLASSHSANNSIQQTLDSDESSVPHTNDSTNETRLSINDETVILHEETTPVCKATPWIFSNTNITQLFKLYQGIIRDMVLQHETLPVESYVHELAAYTHTLVLCKDQQSSIAERVFTRPLLNELTDHLISEVLDLDLPFPQEDLFTLTTTLSNLALGEVTREQTMLDLYIMSSRLAYGPKRIVRSVVNL